MVERRVARREIHRVWRRFRWASPRWGSTHPTATAQTRRERFLNPRPSQRSGLSSTSGARSGLGVLVVVVTASALLEVELTTLKGLVVVEVGRIQT